MSFFKQALAFIEGIKSVIDVPGEIRGTISASISNGIESAFRRIQKPIERSLTRISLMAMSMFFMAWGVALYLDEFSSYRGLGFVIVGAFFGIMVLIFLPDAETR